MEAWPYMEKPQDDLGSIIMSNYNGRAGALKKPSMALTQAPDEAIIAPVQFVMSFEKKLSSQFSLSTLCS